MSWRHIVIESICLYDLNDDDSEIPKQCKYEPGKTGIYCLKHNGDNLLCPFLGYNSAPMSLVLTGIHGNAIDYDGYFEDLRMTSEEQEKKSKEWIQKRKNYWIYIEKINLQITFLSKIMSLIV